MSYTLDRYGAMGIDLYCEDANGKQLAELGDPHSLVQRFLPKLDAEDFPCLRFVDPYGDTVFNQAQIGQLITELERLAKQRHELEVERHLLAVLDFARQACGRDLTYLKFYGD